MNTSGVFARFTISVLVLIMSSCSEKAVEDFDVVPRGSRLLGVSISDRADGDFNTAYTEAAAAGMQMTSLSISWDDVETAPGVYGLTPDFLDIANSYYGATGTKLLIGLNPIDTNNDRRPQHLKSERWDSPAVVNAYKSMLDWAIPKLANVELVALSIGNEIDGTLASESDWQQYRTFYESASEHAKSLRAGLRTGAKITYGGLIGPSSVADSVNSTTDVVLTTYYPLNSDFTIKSPDVVASVFDSLVGRYPGRPILFAEFGAPSSPSCGSSEALQAEFIREAFAAWDRQTDHIEAIEFTWMHDISQAALDVYEQYYGISNPCFLEYLGTLGLKSHAGMNKPAWTALFEEATERGW